jgi:hypothetical protein
MSLRDKLLADVHIFVSETGISESALGVKALSDGAVVSRIRGGKSITLRSADKIYAFMATERARRGATETQAKDIAS